MNKPILSTLSIAAILFLVSCQTPAVTSSSESSTSAAESPSFSLGSKISLAKSDSVFSIGFFVSERIVEKIFHFAVFALLP